MKILILITVILLSLCLNIVSQETRPIIIKANYNDIPFEEFAGIMKQEYGVSIYYKPEWVENIRVVAQGDSLSVNEILSTTFNPLSMNFIRRGNKQFFLTGTKKLDADKISLVDEIITSADSISKSIAEQYFGNYSYEKVINRVEIGIKGAGNNSNISELSGRLHSKINGEPVIGATLIVKGTNNGVVTDGNGTYSLFVKTGSDFTLNISCMGMYSESYLVNINSSGILNIEMSERLIDIQEVVVRSGKHDNVRGMQMGFQRIDMKGIKAIPVVMGEKDILKIATLMPGVQSVGEGAAGLNVRGSSADQNLFLINEIPVLNTGHLFGFFSAFNPDMINNFNLYKSNFPSEYGGRLASIFEVTTRKGNKKKFGARGGISPITGSLVVEAPVVKDKSSIIIGGRSTYSDWILNRIDNPDISNSDASFYDLMAGVHILNEKNSSWQLFGYYSKDKFTLSQSNDYRYENIGASLIYDKKLKDKWRMNVAAVFSNYINYHTSREQLSEAYEHQFKVRSQKLKFNFTGYPWLNHRLKFGADVILHNLDQGSYDPLGSESLMKSVVFGQENGLEYSIFISDEFTVTDKLTVYGGIRYGFFNYLGPNSVYKYGENLPYEFGNIVDTLNYKNGETIRHYSGPEYRLSLNYEIKSDLSVKFSYNRMRQYLFMLSNTVSVAPTDQWKLVDDFIKPPVSDQLSMGLYKNFNSAALETSAEVYLKKGRNIVEYKDGADFTGSPNFETLILQGNQNSYGLEFMVKRNAGRYTGWLSYTWSRSLITVNGDQPWDRINKGLTYPANYDKPHSVNFIGNIKLSRRISIASNIVYSTGRPISYPTSLFYVDGLQVVNYSLRNEYRIPDYFRVDVSLTMEGNLLKKKFAHSSWSLSVYNLTGRKNAYSIYFKNEDGNIKGYKQSIYGVPIFTISYNFKLGNYADN